MKETDKVTRVDADPGHSVISTGPTVAAASDQASAPIATVILLCYKQESTIRRAIESVLRQRCRYSYEILVADDASPDATRRICEEYATRYPETVRMLPPAPNKGLVDNYFDAVLASRGKYVADCGRG